MTKTIQRGRNDNVLRVGCLYTIETKSVLFNLGYYKFKAVIVIPNVTNKRLIKSIQKSKEKGNQNYILLKKHQVFV